MIALDLRLSASRRAAALSAGSNPDPQAVDVLVARCAVESDFFVRDMLAWALTQQDRDAVVDGLLPKASPHRWPGLGPRHCTRSARSATRGRGPPSAELLTDADGRRRRRPLAAPPPTSCRRPAGRWAGTPRTRCCATTSTHPAIEFHGEVARRDDHEPSAARSCARPAITAVLADGGERPVRPRGRARRHAMAAVQLAPVASAPAGPRAERSRRRSALATLPGAPLVPASACGLGEVPGRRAPRGVQHPDCSVTMSRTVRRHRRVPRSAIPFLTAACAVTPNADEGRLRT